jgi:sugar/nucleoside kinase (ribokinase family)
MNRGITVVGSLGYDSIATPFGQVKKVEGGSANYFSLAASIFTNVNVIGVVGKDYSKDSFKILSDRGINCDGVVTANGQSFHWEGKYEGAMNEAITINTELNVFEKFDPVIPKNAKKPDVLFLGNIDPVVQLKILSQVESARIVAVDTMNFWISSKLKDLHKVFQKANVVLVNETEVKTITKCRQTNDAIKAMHDLGPKVVIVKRGEYGFVMSNQGRTFVLPAVFVDQVVDPTGAGDSFAGGVLGTLSMFKNLDDESLRKACVIGCVLASFTVEDFGTLGVQGVTPSKLISRLKHYFETLEIQQDSLVTLLEKMITDYKMKQPA